jgi:hypothetical protein
MSDNDFVLPRSLKPERLEPPSAMGSRRHKLRGPLIILIASIFAAPIGYYFSAGGWGPSLEPAAGPQTASFGPRTNAAPSSIDEQESGLTTAQGQGEISSQHTETSQPARSYFGGTVAIGQPSATGAQASPLSKTIRVLDPEEIKLLMKQGEQFIAAGDVVTARIVFQRAAEAGNANAAMALGATYDPTVLAKLGVVGIGADVEKARSWYQKAENLGAPEARGRLDVLANRFVRPALGAENLGAPEARGRLEVPADRFVRPALGDCALTREPPYQLKSDTVDWTIQISSGQSCVRGLRHGRVTIHTAKLISSPQSGQVKLLGSGFSYTAKSDFQGQDSFTIQVSGMLNGIHGSSDIRIIASVGPK